MHSSLRKTYGVTDPATGKEYAQVEVGMAADVNQAVLAARAALETGPWPGMAAPDRAQVLHGIADAIDARAGDIAAAEATGPRPAGRPGHRAGRAGGRGTSALAADLITARAGTAEACAPGGPGYVLARPAGIAGLITPWRTPFLAQARALAPALAAGCTVVLKPDEWAPLPAALLAEITTAAGLPDGVLNIVHGSLHPRAPGAQARDALIAHPGGAAVVRGRRRHRTADHARRRHARTRLCPAGWPATRPASSSPTPTWTRRPTARCSGRSRSTASDAPPPRPSWPSAPSTTPSSAASPSGRTASASATPSDPATQLGPLPHAEHHDRLTSWVRLGIREGAWLAAGGWRPAGLPEGNYLGATVLADVAPSMPIFAEPVCGPVVRVTPFDTEDEAISLANAVTDPTAAYIWTCDLQRAHRLAPAIGSASTWVNSHNSPDREPAVASLGPGRPGADAGDVPIDFYTRSRTVLIAADDTPAPRFGA